MASFMPIINMLKNTARSVAKGSKTSSGLAYVPPTSTGAPLTYDNNYNPTSTNTVLARPAYYEHLDDLFATRTNDSSPDLLQIMFRTDPDMSAAMHSYLTMADTEPYWEVRDLTGALAPDGYVAMSQLLLSMFTRLDFQSFGYDIRPSLRLYCEKQRYMTLLRGGIAGELLLNDLGWPSQITVVDTNTLRWYETDQNVYVPHQITDQTGADITLDSALVKHVPYRQDPTENYNYSTFVSAINTIATRTEVINDLYRIMRLTGFPRIKATLLEQSLRAVAPEVCKQSESEMRTWLSDRMSEVQNVLTNLSPEQAIVTFDTAEVGMLNADKPASTVDISKVIDVLNAQNQAALKSMAVVLGRGTSGVNTASVEARLFAMNADELNGPLSDLLSYMFTLALTLQGYQYTVKFGFAPAEMRSELELEAYNQIRQTRLLTDLSLGLLTDDEYHLKMYHRPRPESSPLLSGTNFAISGGTIDTTDAGDAPGTSPDSTTRVNAGGTSPSKSKAAGSVAGAGS